MPLTASELVDMSLNKIGQLSPYDSGSDPASFAIGLKWLNMLLAQIVGTAKLWFFVPTDPEVPLTQDVTKYNMVGLTDPPLQFVQNAYIIDPDGNECQLEMIRRDEWEARQTEQNSNPVAIYVERKDRPIMYLIGKPPAAGWKVRLQGQAYSPNVRLSGGNVDHGFPGAWEMWLVFRLARILGSGPVTKIPQSELDDLLRDTKIAWDALDSFNNRENVRKFRYVKYRDL